MWIWTLIKGALGFGPTLASLTQQLTALWTSYQQAQTDKERNAIMERIQTLTLEIQALQGDKLAYWVRAGFAVPYVIYNGKLVLWDKVLGLGSTDPLSSAMWWTMQIVLGFYFVRWLAK